MRAESTHNVNDLFGSVSDMYADLDSGRIDARTARRDGVEACISYLGIERILDAAAQALDVDISSWDDHKRKSAATVILLSLSFEQ